MSTDKRSALDSGVPRLDLIFGGGIPKGDLVLIVGAPGSGKTTLACQIAFHRAKAGQKVLFVSTMSEPASRLIKHLRTLTFFDESAVQRTVLLESIFPVAQQGIEPLLRALVASVRSHGAELLVLDGFASLRDLHPDASELRTIVNQLAVSMTALGCTTIVTSSDVPDMRSVSSPPEFTMCDSILELSQSLPGERLRRTLRAWKVRGRKPLLGPHAFRIDEDGLAVFPRLGLHTLPVGEQESSSTRRSWGSEQLDALMTGGLPSGSSTILAGAPGTGKTLLALQFLLHGATQGEVGLLVSLRESEAQLVRKARSLGLDLETPLAAQRLVVLRRIPSDLEVDELLHDVWSTIDRVGATRVVFDSTAELELALCPEHRAGGLAVFMELLRVRGITAVFVRGVGQRVGPELDFVDSPLEVFAENVVLLRYAELGSALSRVVSVLKMREAAYDPSIRQYVLDAGGLRVLAAHESAPDVLHRIADLPAERVKRAVGPPEGRDE
jgi:circadian clock protein KaiC